MKPAFIKIWVDNRGGRVQTLTPPLYRAIIAEAHKHNVAVGVHNVTAADAKALMQPGVAGWLHLPVRRGAPRADRPIAVAKQGIPGNSQTALCMPPPVKP